MSSPIKCPTCGTNLLTEKRLEKLFKSTREAADKGVEIPSNGEMDIDPAKLLKKVVTAVVNYGHADILYEFPELLEFLGARIPSEDELKSQAELFNVYRKSNSTSPNS